MRPVGLAFSLSTSLLLSVAPAIHAQATPAEKPAALKWGLAPAVFPPGARMAVVSGDPTKAGLFTAQLAMPSGYKIPPHFHPTDEVVEVKKGTLLVGQRLDRHIAEFVSWYAWYVFVTIRTTCRCSRPRKS